MLLIVIIFPRRPVAAKYDYTQFTLNNFTMWTWAVSIHTEIYFNCIFLYEIERGERKNRFGPPFLEVYYVGLEF